VSEENTGESARPEAEAVSQAVLLPLLQECTALLRARCEEHLQADERRRWWLLLSGGIAATFTLAMIVLVFAGQFQRGASFSPLLMTAWVGTLAVIMLRVAESHLLRRRIRFSRYQARAAADRLSKLVRLSSQMEDHAVQDMGLRVMLDVRLSEAESMLRLAASILDNENLPDFENAAVHEPANSLSTSDVKGNDHEASHDRNLLGYETGRRTRGARQPI
jgi:hypothetical protein